MNLYVTDAWADGSFVSKVSLSTFTATNLGGGNASYVGGANPLFGNQPFGIANDGTRLLIGDTNDAAVRILF